MRPLAGMRAGNTDRQILGPVNPWQVRMTGTGPAPAGMVPCRTVGDVNGGACCPLLLAGWNLRADHYHPAGILARRPYR